MASTSCGGHGEKRINSGRKGYLKSIGTEKDIWSEPGPRMRIHDMQCPFKGAIS